jgi:hypothetical protein
VWILFFFAIFDFFIYSVYYSHGGRRPERRFSEGNGTGKRVFFFFLLIFRVLFTRRPPSRKGVLGGEWDGEGEEDETSK